MSTASAQGGNTYYGITSILIVAILAFFLLRPAIETKLRSESLSVPIRTLPDPEHLNPTTYLQAGGTYRTNFWLTKFDVSGTVSNTALHTNYKDVVVTVNFYSRTNTLLTSKSYTLYDFFPYGVQKGFFLSVDRPAAAATCGWQISGATAY